jgi:preprotein translocase subunit SecG
MKKITVLLLAAFLGALLCTACVTKKGNNNSLNQGRDAAVDATGRMNNALD